MQNHIHDRDDVGERLFLFAVERPFLQFAILSSRSLWMRRFEVVVSLAQESGRTTRAVVNGLAKLWLHHLHHRPNKRSGRVILASIPSRVAHVLDLRFVQVRKLMLLGLRAETEFIDVVDDLSQVVTAPDLVFDLAEDLPNLVFDGIRPAGPLLKAVQVRDELLVDEIAKIIAAQRLVVVEFSILAFRSCPALPAIRLVENVRVLLPLQCRYVGSVLLKAIEVLEEQKPRRLLGVVELRRTASLLSEDIVDISKRLFKHVGKIRKRSSGRCQSILVSCAE